MVTDLSSEDPRPEGMGRVPRGETLIGSDHFYPEECPEHIRVIAPFAIDLTPVTNAEFARFIRETGYITTAERPVEGYPGLSEELRAPGSIVFTPTSGPVDLHDWRQWWRWVPGACWRHPGGPATSIEGLDDHPVVQVSFWDACEYAAWVGKRLPTEFEFECAARAGSTTVYPWGQERDPDGRFMANTYRGRFPYANTADDGWAATSPVGSFPANALGLYDMIGNVWEWTSSYYTPHHLTAAGPTVSDVTGAGCCAPSNVDISDQRDTATPGTPTTSEDPELAAASAEPGSTVPRRVIKGGSHLCAPEYCLRYRPSARSPQAEDSATNHIGFRCARDI